MATLKKTCGLYGCCVFLFLFMMWGLWPSFSTINDIPDMQDMDPKSRKQIEAMMMRHPMIGLPTKKPQPRIVDWDLTFSFVPEHLIVCKELFQDRNKANPLTPNVRQIFQEYRALLERLNVTANDYNNMEVERAMLYWELAKLPFVHTICESGFHSGVAAIVWLGAKASTVLYSFETMENKATKSIVDFLKRKFHGRLDVKWGSTKQTLPLFVYSKHQIKCDLIILDGERTYDSFLSDFNNFRKIASYNNVIVFNNYPFHYSSWGFHRKEADLWESKKKNAHVTEAFRCFYDINNKSSSLSVGRVL